MLPEYDFSGKKAVRGKYYRSLEKGYTVRVLNEDGTVTIRDFVPKENAELLEPNSESEQLVAADEFSVLTKQARKQAKLARLKPKDIKSAIAKARKND